MCVCMCACVRVCVRMLRLPSSPSPDALGSARPRPSCLELYHARSFTVHLPTGAQLQPGGASPCCCVLTVLPGQGCFALVHTMRGQESIKIYLSFSARPSWDTEQAAPLLGSTPRSTPLVEQCHCALVALPSEAWVHLTPCAQGLGSPGFMCQPPGPVPGVRPGDLEHVCAVVAGGKDLGLWSQRDLRSCPSF